MFKLAFLLIRNLAIFIALAVICLGAFALLNVAIARNTISRVDLQISDGVEKGACVRKTLPFYPPPYNQQLAANDYVIYAIASLNAYLDEKITRFVVSSYDSGFTELPMVDTQGLIARVYYKDGPEPEAIVAFRGTRATNLGDWYSNFSWFTAVLPWKNHYEIARDEFVKIEKSLRVKAAGKPIKIVVTGHSLGGGLAQHIAFGFPCISAVAFDTSPAINKFVYKQPYDDAVVVHLHDRQDELTWLTHLFFSEQDSTFYRWYPLDLVPPGTFRHDITRFAIGMAGMATDCQLHAVGYTCAIPSGDTRAQDLYCPTFGQIDEKCQPTLRRVGIQ